MKNRRFPVIQWFMFALFAVAFSALCLYMVGALFSVPGGFGGPAPVQARTPVDVAGQLLWRLAQVPVVGDVMMAGERVGLKPLYLLLGALLTLIAGQAAKLLWRQGQDRGPA